jgi:hypothetical protein
MMANCLLPGSTTIGWYLGVVVLDLVTGGHGRVFFTSFCFTYWAYVRTLIRYCVHVMIIVYLLTITHAAF